MSGPETGQEYVLQTNDVVQLTRDGFGELSVRRGFSAAGGASLGLEVTHEGPFALATAENAGQLPDRSEMLVALAERLAAEVGCCLVAKECDNGQ